MCVYIYVYKYIDVCIYINVCKYIYIYMYTGMWAAVAEAYADGRVTAVW